MSVRFSPRENRTDTNFGPSVQFAQDWYDRFQFHARRRMCELGIPESRIGAYDIDYGFRQAAFFPKERTGGENSPGARINLNSGLLNPHLLAQRFGPEMAEVWEKSRLERSDKMTSKPCFPPARLEAPRSGWPRPARATVLSQG